MVTIWRRAASLSDAGLLFLKLSAFVLMVLDHADWLVFDGALGMHSTVGRIVAPAFALVLAINLQRVRGVSHELQMIGRMALVGAIAHVPYAVLQGHFLPLNIMFTLALAVGVVSLWRSGHTLLPLALVMFVAAGVDYAWFGVAAVFVAYWLVWRGVSLWVVASVVAALFAVWNGSLWSFLLLPLLFAATRLRGSAPRLKWLFYVGYPAHLVVLAIIHAAVAA